MEEKTSMLSKCKGLLITFCKLTFMLKDFCFTSIEHSAYLCRCLMLCLSEKIRRLKALCESHVYDYFFVLLIGTSWNYYWDNWFVHWYKELSVYCKMSHYSEVLEILPFSTIICYPIDKQLCIWESSEQVLKTFLSSMMFVFLITFPKKKNGSDVNKRLYVENKDNFVTEPHHIWNNEIWHPDDLQFTLVKPHLESFQLISVPSLP